ncbi:MAG: ThiF family adenylyltransferase [Hyphomicrobiaceae bacterium]
MSIALANHNPDVRRLLEKGYALRLDSAHLVVRDIPYIDTTGGLKWGAFVTVLVFKDKELVQQQDHQVFFAGSVPYGLNGQPIPNLAGGQLSIPLVKKDVVVERSFSNKPPKGFADFFEKIEHYTNVVAGPAIEKFKVSPFTFAVDTDEAPVSVFKFQDTLTSRAEIGDLASLLKNDVIAIIGLGGTGAYVLDYMVKTPVKEIHGFDGDDYFIHNAYRSPGAVLEAEFRKGKAEVYQGRYDNFRNGLFLHRKYIDRSCAADLAGVTFAFVCVDKGSARAEIFDLLIHLGIPFIDVGMGLNRKQGPLSGTLRATFSPDGEGDRVRAQGWAEMTDLPDDQYRRNIQISELNAMNAAVAVIRYKQLRGFYFDEFPAQHLLMETGSLRVLSESLP